MSPYFGTGDISPVSGTVNDLQSEARIESIIAKSADSSGINTTFCLGGPTGSRLAARFVPLSSSCYLHYILIFSEV